MRLLTTWYFGYLLLAISPLLAQSDLSKEKQVDALFEKWNDTESPGVAVSIVKEGKILYQQGYGMATLAYSIPNNPSTTVFEAASISKQFTSFCILLLERQGKVSLDDDIRSYIPEVPDFGYPLTLRQLATHTSGLRDQWDLLKMAGWRMDDVITNDHVFRLISRQKELNFRPGEEFSYSNTGHTLLAEVVSRVSGQTFDNFAQQYLFKPLGMTHSLFFDDHQRIVKHLASSYDGNLEEGFRKSVLSISSPGATNLFTTAEDMAKWAINFDHPTVGDAALIKQLNECPQLKNGKPSRYALGQYTSTYKGLPVFEHSGAEAAYESYFIRFPKQQFAVTILSNHGSFWAENKAKKICNIYLEEAFEEGNVEDKIAKSIDTLVKVILLAPKIQQQYCSTYWNESEGIQRAIRFENDTLRYIRNEQNHTNLLPIAPNKFILQGLPTTVQVHFSLTSGNAYEMLFSDTGYQLLFEPMSTFELGNYTGRYYSEELDTYYTLAPQQGKLVAQHQRNKDILLTPISANKFHSRTWFFKQVIFEENELGKITGFRVSNRGVKNLLFTRCE